MRKFTLSAAIVLASISLSAQNDLHNAISDAAKALAEAPAEQAPVAKPNYWKKTGVVTLGFDNTSFKVWAAGGYNTTKLNTTFNGSLNYAKDLMSWSNSLQLAYGFIYSEDKPIIQKNTDNIYFLSKWGYKTGAKSKFNYSASIDFRSQFTNTFAYSTPAGEDQGRSAWKANRKLKSGPFSPAYTTVALGIDWNPKPWFSVIMAPLSGSVTMVANKDLRKTYGMALKDEFESAETKEAYMYKAMRFQFGAKMQVNFKLAINDIINYSTQLTTFSDYLNKPQNMRINWDNTVSWKIAKHIMLGFNSWLIYDPLVLIDGTQKVQFKDYIGLTLTYNLVSK